MDGKELYGRELTRSECRNAEEALLILAEKRPGLTSANGKRICNRCGNQDRKKMLAAPCACGTTCFYCLSCLNMGKIKSCTVLHHLPEINAFERPIEPILQWQGQLSSEQQRASEEIVETVQAEETRLIWAVAGAGKTEMIFEGIAACLRKGGRVCLASPRVDVCLELAPRIKQAFPAVPMALLYGGNEDGYSYTPLVIATTHQLLRFREAFDLLIIDEIDSFPYHDDLGLQFGAQKSRKKASALIYLTATPSQMMQNDIKRDKLAATVLPARYHGFALPEPIYRLRFDAGAGLPVMGSETGGKTRVTSGGNIAGEQGKDKKPNVKVPPPTNIKKEDILPESQNSLPLPLRIVLQAKQYFIFVQA